MLVRWAAAAAVMAVALPGFADEVVLRNGAVFTGVVREDGDRVELEKRRWSFSWSGWFPSAYRGLPVLSAPVRGRPEKPGKAGKEKDKEKE